MRKTKPKRHQPNSVYLWLTDSRRYRLVSVSIIMLICLVIGLFSLFSYQQIGEIYTNETSAAIIELKRVFLKNTVDNLIQELETTRTIEAKYYKSAVEQRYEAYSIRNFICNDFTQSLIADFRPNDQPEIHVPQWTVFIWEEDGTVVYDPAGLFEGDIAGTIEKIKPRMSHYRIIHHENTSCLFGFSQDYVEDVAKAAMAVKIKSLHFANNSYIWVNEIRDYNGGRDYAIRRIPPNLPETEGMLLSTEMEDIQGNLPYLTELEGVKKDGELFFSYYFKELNSDTVSEKLTYAKLYKPYGWVVAMGIQNNEMERYIAQTSGKSRVVALSKTMELLAILLIAVLICLAIIFAIERWRLKRSKEQLELEFQFDPLTNAKSRRFGTQYLENAFYHFKEDEAQSSTAVMLFDIDNFKEINDRYGHAEGDRVLKEIVPAVYQAIRSTDELFRWGGDEFVGVFSISSEENTMRLMEKILHSVSSIQFKTSSTENTLHISVSIGVSHFKSGDSCFGDALDRADKAMYLSKAEGGNRVTAL